VNPSYSGTFVFDNDFSALLPGVGPADGADDPLLRAEPTSGICRVICFHPRHDLTLAEMDVNGIAGVVDTWTAETAALGESYRWVQVFENKGAAMGCSNPHPHGQIWASSAIPSEPANEDRLQRAYFDRHRSPLLCDYARRERELSLRVVCENDSFLAVVPFWASWPFETLVLPRRRVARLPDLALAERAGLAALLRTLLGAYDRLFEVAPGVQAMGPAHHAAPSGCRPKHCPAAVALVDRPDPESFKVPVQIPPTRGVVSSRQASGVVELTNGYLTQTASPAAMTAQLGARWRAAHEVAPPPWLTLASVTSLGLPPPRASSTNQQLSPSLARSTPSAPRLSSSIHPVGPAAHSLTTMPAGAVPCARAARQAARHSTRPSIR